MKTFIVLVFATVLMLDEAVGQRATSPNVALPNVNLIGCKGSGCSQIWQDLPINQSAIYPHNISIDIENGAVLGIVAHYDKTLSLIDLKTSIEDHYGKSTYVIDNETSPVKVWRVEPAKVAIQLSAEDNGMKEVIYLSASAWRERHKPQVP